MKPAEARAIVNMHTPPKPVTDPFAHLPESVLAVMRQVAAKVQNLGLPIEVHPTLTDTFSFLFENRLISVSAVEQAGGFHTVIVSLEGRLNAMPVEDLLTLLPDPEAPKVTPIRVFAAAPPAKRDHREILEDILTEMRELRAELRAVR